MSILIGAVSWLFQIYGLLILIRVVLTWMNTDPYQRTLDHPLVHLLHRLTDPLLSPLRRIIPPIGGTIDVSPVAALFIVEIARRILVSLLSNLL